MTLLERLLISQSAAFLVLLGLAKLAQVHVTLFSAWKAGLFIYAFTFMCITRVVVNYTVTELGRRRVLTRNVVIVGAGHNGVQLLQQLHNSQNPCTRILCLFDDRARDPGGRAPRRLHDYPILGTTQDLIAFSRRYRVDDIVIALPWSAERRIGEILNALRVVPANVHLSPAFINNRNHKVATISGLPVITMMDKPVSGRGWLAKALLDRSLAAIGILLLSPFLLAVAAAIKLDSPGPVLFKQKRLGFNNRPFHVYKFRSMYQDKCDFSASQLATRNDPRVTRIGRIIRRTSIDELPQLFNVLLGDMSLVGPRPHAVKAHAGGRLYEEVVTEYALRHKIKPGITGWAQVNGWRGETDTVEKIVKRVEYDLHYINNWSLSFDIYIILMTILKVPFQKNAY